MAFEGFLSGSLWKSTTIHSKIINCSYLSACSSSSLTYCSQLWNHQRLPTALKTQSRFLSRGCKTSHDLSPVPSVTFLLPLSLSLTVLWSHWPCCPSSMPSPCLEPQGLCTFSSLGISKNASDLLQVSALKSSR